ncbi:MAG: hypothetical protein Q7S13_01320, partial [Candidatus Omnitrophota bacterium]|nr:hypothetical protein [Candidatus Omnitrophota bacterium]
DVLAYLYPLDTAQNVLDQARLRFEPALSRAGTGFARLVKLSLDEKSIFIPRTGFDQIQLQDWLSRYLGDSQPQEKKKVALDVLARETIINRALLLLDQPVVIATLEKFAGSVTDAGIRTQVASLVDQIRALNVPPVYKFIRPRDHRRLPQQRGDGFIDYTLASGEVIRLANPDVNQPVDIQIAQGAGNSRYLPPHSDLVNPRFVRISEAGAIEDVNLPQDADAVVYQPKLDGAMISAAARPLRILGSDQLAEVVRQPVAAGARPKLIYIMSRDAQNNTFPIYMIQDPSVLKNVAPQDQAGMIKQRGVEISMAEVNKKGGNLYLAQGVRFETDDLAGRNMYRKFMDVFGRQKTEEILVLAGRELPKDHPYHGITASVRLADLGILDNRLEAEKHVAQSISRGQTQGVALIDINGLKRLNVYVGKLGANLAVDDLKVAEATLVGWLGSGSRAFQKGSGDESVVTLPKNNALSRGLFKRFKREVEEKVYLYTGVEVAAQGQGNNIFEQKRTHQIVEQLGGRISYVGSRYVFVFGKLDPQVDDQTFLAQRISLVNHALKLQGNRQIKTAWLSGRFQLSLSIGFADVTKDIVIPADEPASGVELAEKKYNAALEVAAARKQTAHDIYEKNYLQVSGLIIFEGAQPLAVTQADKPSVVWSDIAIQQIARFRAFQDRAQTGLVRPDWTPRTVYGGSIEAGKDRIEQIRREDPSRLDSSFVVYVPLAGYDDDFGYIQAVKDANAKALIPDSRKGAGENKVINDAPQWGYDSGNDAKALLADGTINKIVSTPLLRNYEAIVIGEKMGGPIVAFIPQKGKKVEFDIHTPRGRVRLEHALFRLVMGISVDFNAVSNIKGKNIMGIWDTLIPAGRPLATINPNVSLLSLALVDLEDTRKKEETVAPSDRKSVTVVRHVPQVDRVLAQMIDEQRAEEMVKTLATLKKLAEDTHVLAAKPVPVDSDPAMLARAGAIMAEGRAAHWTDQRIAEEMAERVSDDLGAAFVASSSTKGTPLILEYDSAMLSDVKIKPETTWLTFYNNKLLVDAPNHQKYFDDFVARFLNSDPGSEWARFRQMVENNPKALRKLYVEAGLPPEDIVRWKPVLDAVLQVENKMKQAGGNAGPQAPDAIQPLVPAPMMQQAPQPTVPTYIPAILPPPLPLARRAVGANGSDRKVSTLTDRETVVLSVNDYVSRRPELASVASATSVAVGGSDEDLEDYDEMDAAMLGGGSGNFYGDILGTAYDGQRGPTIYEVLEAFASLQGPQFDFKEFQQETAIGLSQSRVVIGPVASGKTSVSEPVAAIHAVMNGDVVTILAKDAHFAHQMFSRDMLNPAGGFITSGEEAARILAGARMLDVEAAFEEYGLLERKFSEVTVTPEHREAMIRELHAKARQLGEDLNDRRVIAIISKNTRAHAPISLQNSPYYALIMQGIRARKSGGSYRIFEEVDALTSDTTEAIIGQDTNVADSPVMMDVHRKSDVIAKTAHVQDALYANDANDPEHKKNPLIKHAKSRQELEQMEEDNELGWYVEMPGDETLTGEPTIVLTKAVYDHYQDYEKPIVSSTILGMVTKLGAVLKVKSDGTDLEVVTKDGEVADRMLFGNLSFKTAQAEQARRLGIADVNVPTTNSTGENVAANGMQELFTDLPDATGRFGRSAGSSGSWKGFENLIRATLSLNPDQPIIVLDDKDAIDQLRQGMHRQDIYASRREAEKNGGTVNSYFGKEAETKVFTGSGVDLVSQLIYESQHGQGIDDYTTKDGVIVPGFKEPRGVLIGTNDYLERRDMIAALANVKRLTRRLTAVPVNFDPVAIEKEIRAEIRQYIPIKPDWDQARVEQEIDRYLAANPNAQHSYRKRLFVIESDPGKDTPRIQWLAKNAGKYKLNIIAPPFIGSQWGFPGVDIFTFRAERYTTPVLTQLLGRNTRNINIEREPRNPDGTLGEIIVRNGRMNITGDRGRKIALINQESLNDEIAFIGTQVEDLENKGEELGEEAGTHLDPLTVKTFAARFRQIDTAEKQALLPPEELLLRQFEASTDYRQLYHKFRSHERKFLSHMRDTRIMDPLSVLSGAQSPLSDAGRKVANQERIRAHAGLYSLIHELLNRVVSGTETIQMASTHMWDETINMLTRVRDGVVDGVSLDGQDRRLMDMLIANARQRKIDEANEFPSLAATDQGLNRAIPQLKEDLERLGSLPVAQRVLDYDRFSAQHRAILAVGKYLALSGMLPTRITPSSQPTQTQRWASPARSFDTSTMTADELAQKIPDFPAGIIAAFKDKNSGLTEGDRFTLTYRGSQVVEIMLSLINGKDMTEEMVVTLGRMAGLSDGEVRDVMLNRQQIVEKAFEISMRFVGGGLPDLQEATYLSQMDAFWDDRIDQSNQWTREEAIKHLSAMAVALHQGNQSTHYVPIRVAQEKGVPANDVVLVALRGRDEVQSTRVRLIQQVNQLEAEVKNLAPLIGQEKRKALKEAQEALDALTARYNSIVNPTITQIREEATRLIGDNLDDPLLLLQFAAVWTNNPQLAAIRHIDRAAKTIQFIRDVHPQWLNGQRLESIALLIQHPLFVPIVLAPQAEAAKSEHAKALKKAAEAMMKEAFVSKQALGQFVSILNQAPYLFGLSMADGKALAEKIVKRLKKTDLEKEQIVTLEQLLGDEDLLKGRQDLALWLQIGGFKTLMTGLILNQSFAALQQAKPGEDIVPIENYLAGRPDLTANESLDIQKRLRLALLTLMQQGFNIGFLPDAFNSVDEIEALAKLYRQHKATPRNPKFPSGLLDEDGYLTHRVRQEVFDDLGDVRVGGLDTVLAQLQEAVVRRKAQELGDRIRRKSAVDVLGKEVHVETSPDRVIHDVAEIQAAIGQMDQDNVAGLAALDGLVVSGNNALLQPSIDQEQNKGYLSTVVVDNPDRLRRDLTLLGIASTEENLPQQAARLVRAAEKDTVPEQTIKSKRDKTDKTIKKLRGGNRDAQTGEEIDTLSVAKAQAAVGLLGRIQNPDSLPINTIEETQDAYNKLRKEETKTGRWERTQRAEAVLDVLDEKGFDHELSDFIPGFPVEDLQDAGSKRGVVPVLGLDGKELKFMTVEQARQFFINQKGLPAVEDQRILVVNFGGEIKAYPLAIVGAHQIINDVIRNAAGEEIQIAVTNC